MADGDTQPQTTDDLMARLGPLVQMLQAPTGQVQPVAAQAAAAGPDTRSGSVGGWLSLLGEGLAGGSQVPMSPEDKMGAGLRALQSFGMNLMEAGGRHAGVRPTVGQIVAQGMSGAQESMLQSAATQAGILGAQQSWQQQQFQNRMEALKEALPLLTTQLKMQMANAPNPLLGGGGGQVAKPGILADPVANMPKEDALSAIALRESGNKNVPNAQGGDASGYWQIRDQTWKDAAPSAGVDLKQYPRAIDAPWEIQHKVAGALFDKQGAVPWAASNPNAAPQTTAQGGKQPAPPATAVATVTPSATLQAGAPTTMAAQGVPVPPGAPPGAATAPYTGGGIGAVLGGGPQVATTLPVPPLPPKEGVPLPGDSGLVRLPSGGVVTKGGGGIPVAQAIEAGRQEARATPVPPGTVATAGPGAGTLPAATPGVEAKPQPGWGTVIGSYGNAPPAAAPQPTTQPMPVPAPQVTTQATQPPAPGGKLSFEQWQEQHPSLLALTDAERAASTVQPPNLDELRRAQQAAAQQLQQARAGFGGDPNKSISDYNTATQAITNAQAQATAKSAELTQALLAAKRSEAQRLYNEEQTRLQAPELEAQRGQQQIQLEQVKTNEAQRAKVLEGLDTDTKAAQNTIQQLQGLQELSKAAGPATLLSPDMREWLTKLNLTSPEQVDQFAAQKALDAANQRLITAMRQGTGFQRTTNMDLQFLLHSTPGGAEVPPQFRDATTAFLLNSARRTMQFNQLVQGYMSDHTTTYADAAARADKELGPVIQQMPKNTYTPGSDDELKWKWDNILPGEFYKDYGPDGKPRLRIFKGDTPRPE